MSVCPKTHDEKARSFAIEFNFKGFLVIYTDRQENIQTHSFLEFGAALKKYDELKAKVLESSVMPEEVSFFSVRMSPVVSLLENEDAIPF